ncbi:FMN-dependent alpha-hydroxy acid dehydrogenase [Saccharata proteae CBS 121410]|uniref:FMN-dependent alpha-hydroxy acid dehydrogenase n=1 Tax=Saccharata proteae CBS 121410 TaxID=1314787 RepID=A0A9P4LRD1_9PEZI|nr:FMN-dependent alpha-hydroxy acid dehydrogenase [Saccharata proteae CBS 121410]
MSATNAVQDPHPDARKYGAYQNEIYAKGMFHNVLPAVTTDPNKLEEQAKKALGSRSYNYVAGAAGERATLDANRLAFRQWKLIPRMLRPTTHRDMRIKLFGEELESPLLFAPIGVQGIFHEDKETGVAEIAAEIGVPYIMSTAASSSIEEVAKASGKGRRWFQLYWPQDDEITLSLLKRAKDNGFSALVVTLDTWALAWRPWDLDGAYVPFIKGVGVETGFTDPVFRRKFEEKHGKTVEEDRITAAQEWTATAFSGAAHSWDQVALLRKNWDGPILLKGIQHPADALKAVECKVDGIIVSNHGGRQLDGAIGSLTMLPEIVDAVGGKLTVLFDSGARTGTDIIKALSLGADAVCIGRPWCYGLGIAGKAGARDVMRGILADLDQSMGLAGIQDIEGCDRSMLRKVEYAGERFSCN